MHHKEGMILTFRLSTKLNSISHLLTLLEAHSKVHNSRIKVKKDEDDFNSTPVHSDYMHVHNKTAIKSYNYIFKNLKRLRFLEVFFRTRRICIPSI
jgi:hypothetical protein